MNEIIIIDGRLFMYLISKFFSNSPSRPFMVLVFKVIGQVSLRHPSIIFKHIRRVLRYSKCSDSVKSEHPNLSLSPFHSHLPNSEGFLGWEVHYWIFSALEEMVDHKVKYIGVVILLIHDFSGKDLY